MNYVAVYGTLRVGEGNWAHFLQESKHMGTHRISGFTMVTNQCFPYVFKGDGEITVDMFEVSDDTFTSLDRLEGYPLHYDRIQIRIDEYTAWIYTNERAANRGLAPVPSGDWIDYHPEYRRSYANTK